MPFRFFRTSVPVSTCTPLVELDPALWAQVSGGSSGPHGGWVRPAGEGAAASHAVASVDTLGPHGGWKTGDFSGPHGGW